jgi:CHASE3 domain sensor protein
MPAHLTDAPRAPPPADTTGAGTAVGRSRIAAPWRVGLRDLSIARKLGMGFGIILALTIVTSCFVFAQARSMAEAERVNTTSDEAIKYLEQMRYDVETSRTAIRDYAIGGDDADWVKVEMGLRAARRDAASARTIIARDGPELLPAFDRYAAATDAYDKAVTLRYLRLAKRSAEGRAASMALIGRHEGKPYRAEMEASHTALRDRADAWAREWDRRGSAAVLDTAAMVALSGVIMSAVCLLMIGSSRDPFRHPCAT